MKFGAMVRTGAALLLLNVIAVAGDKDNKAKEGQMVDSGTLGVFMNGHRVATETFSVQQNAGGSVITSQFKTEEGENPVSGQQAEREHPQEDENIERVTDPAVRAVGHQGVLTAGDDRVGEVLAQAVERPEQERWHKQEGDRRTGPAQPAGQGER